MRVSLSTAAIAAATVVLIGGCTAVGGESPGTTAPVPSPAAGASPIPATATAPSVAEVLAGIPIKGRAPKTGYTRDQFGQAWSDDVPVEFGHNGCDTRNDILKRDLVDITMRGNSTCVVASGTLHDPYTGTTIDFVRGNDTSTAVQIDHVVPLSDAWQKGAQQLDPDTRRALANDPRNLLAVDGPTNQRKSDGDAATWLPPNRGYWCSYVTAQTEVKAAYGLWMTQAEHDRIGQILDGCTDSGAPSR